MVSPAAAASRLTEGHQEVPGLQGELIGPGADSEGGWPLYGQCSLLQLYLPLPAPFLLLPQLDCSNSSAQTLEPQNLKKTPEAPQGVKELSWQGGSILGMGTDTGGAVSVFQPAFVVSVVSGSQDTASGTWWWGAWGRLSPVWRN